MSKTLKQLDDRVYRAWARRELYEDGNTHPSADELQSVADYLRWEDFKRNIEPYERIRTRLMSDFLSYGTKPVAPLPKTLQDTIVMLNQRIESIAEQFGIEILK